MTEYLIGVFRKTSSEEVRVTIETWHGRPIVNIRVWWYSASDNEMRPSRKGLAISVDRLPYLLSILSKAMATVSPTWRPAA